MPALEHKYWTDAGEESRSSTPRIADNFKNVRRVIGNAEMVKRLRTYEWDKEVWMMMQRRLTHDAFFPRKGLSVGPYPR